MTGPRPAEFLRHLAADAVSDHDLLRRFAATRDGAAFAELVRRHGPVVLAACRRGTRNHHDGDDAFQAVFLTLARRAGAVQQPELLGNWLYGVAVRVARHARRAAARRRVREVQGVEVPEPAAAPTTILHDLGPVLDEELEALPALHRDAVALCDLRGVSRADAAVQLGIPLGTLASRLDAARKKLAARLIRRGVTLSVAGVLVEARAVALPEVLLTKTCEVVAVWSSGGAMPPAVLKLVQGGLSMRSVVLGGVVVLSLAAGVTVAAGFADRTAPTAPPPQPPEPLAVAVVATEAQPKEVVPVKLGAGQLMRRENVNVGTTLAVAWNRDGTWLAVHGTSRDNNLVVLSAFDPALRPGVGRLSEDARMLGFAANGHELLTVTQEDNLISGENSLRVWMVGTPAHRPNVAGPVRVVTSFTPVAPHPLEEAMTEATPGRASYEVCYIRRAAEKAGASRVEVRRLDLRNGEVRTLGSFEGVFKSAHLVPGAERVVAVTKGGAVECYEAEGGKRLWASVPPPAPPGGLRFTPAEVGPPQPVPSLTAVSADGSRVLVCQSTPVVLDGNTGKALPPPEGVVWVMGVEGAVSGDGRLAALSYTPAVETGVKGPEQRPLFGPGLTRLTVWETATGRVVRSWLGNVSALAFHPTQPVLAVLEPNRDGTRLGLWDFAAQR